MGYLTSYDLAVIKGSKEVMGSCPTCGTPNQTSENILDVIGKKYEEVGYILGGDDSKWYDHEEQMKAISLEWPEQVFELRGEGEEAGDVWVKYFANGKMQESKANIQLDGFDPSKLGGD